jgi:hypothetical protein
MRLYVSCPPTGTLKGLLYEILLALDLELGTDFYQRWLNRYPSTDILLINVCLILSTHNVGVLVLDELQHLKARGYAETETQLNFFVALMNFLRVPLICIGTYAARKVIEGTLRDPRRLSGLGCIEFSRYEENEDITKTMEDYYLGFLPMPPDSKEEAFLRSSVYDIYQGIHALLPNLVQRCAAEMAYRGLKHLTRDVLGYYQRVELKLLERPLEILRRRDPDAVQHYDDLVGPETLKEWRAGQQKIDTERIKQGQTQTPAATTAELSRTFEAEGFPCRHFTEIDIAREVKRTRAIFGDGDLYPAFKKQGLLAGQILRGKLTPSA